MAGERVNRDQLLAAVTQLTTDHAALVADVESLLDGVEEADLVGDEVLIRVDGRTARNLRRLTSGP